MTTASHTARHSRGLALAILCAGQLMIVLDTTIVNVALPSIQDDLGFSQSNLAWVVNAYLITFGGLLLVAGRFGDMLGRKRMFLAGLSVFTLASLLCGASTSQWLLITARFIQGVGGAMASAVILGMIVSLFPEPAEQTRAIATYSIVISAGASIGLIAGGALTQTTSWHWIFLVNIPIGVVVIAFAVKLLQHEEGLGLSHGADATGALLITGALMLGVYAIIGTSDHGWASARTLTLAAIAIVLLGAFLLRQHTAANPLMPLRIFRSRPLSGANVVQVMFTGGQFGVFFLGTLLFQHVLHYDALKIGFAFVPVPLSLGFVTLFLSARLINRFGIRPVLVAGLVVSVAGMLLFTQADAGAVYARDLLPAFILIGLGLGLTIPAVITAAMAGVAPQDSGLASGLINTTQQVGGALGLSVLATLAASRIKTRVSEGRSEPDALTAGYHFAFAVAAGLCAIGIVVAFAMLPGARAARGVDDETLEVQAAT